MYYNGHITDRIWGFAPDMEGASIYVSQGWYYRQYWGIRGYMIFGINPILHGFTLKHGGGGQKDPPG